MLKKFIVVFTVVLYPLIAHAGLFAYQDKATNLWGFRNRQERLVIAPQFSAHYVLPDHEVFSPKNKETEFLVGVIKDGTAYRITKDGQIKFESVFFDNGPDYYEEGLARFIDPKTGKVGFHDMKGNVVIQPVYDFASPFKNGVAHVCNGCYAQYPQNPKFRPLSADTCPRRLDEMYPEIIGGKWGKIDKKGKVIVPLIYNSFKEMEKNQKKW